MRFFNLYTANTIVYLETKKVYQPLQNTQTTALQWKIRTCLLEMFCKKSVLKNFAKFTGKNLRWIPSLCSQTCNFAYKWFPLANGCFWKLLYGNLCLKAITILWIFLSDFQTTTGKFLGPCQRFMVEFFAKIGNC